uniref:Phage protein n=1 Tax=Meloidogyne hapla TaxID=6305 RepID=A0A1I8BQ76_MELHA
MIAQHLGIGTTVDHTKFDKIFPVAFNILMEKSHKIEIKTIYENAQEIKKTIGKFNTRQLGILLETVEKAIDEKDEEGQLPEFPEMPKKIVETKNFELKEFSDVLKDFVNSDGEKRNLID